MMEVEIGVGSVITDELSVVADRGYDRSGIEVLGVTLFLLKRELLMRALREDADGGMLSDLNLELETLDCRREAGSIVLGMSRGAN
jgi:hypothetical protein